MLLYGSCGSWFRTGFSCTMLPSFVENENDFARPLHSCPTCFVIALLRSSCSTVPFPSTSCRTASVARHHQGAVLRSGGHFWSHSQERMATQTFSTALTMLCIWILPVPDLYVKPSACFLHERSFFNPEERVLCSQNVASPIVGQDQVGSRRFWLRAY